MDDKQATGKLGEKLAANFLQNNGYQVLDRNYRYKRGEIDLIALKDGVLVFVEVKARRRAEPDFGNPEEAVTARKAQQVIACADAYIQETNWQGDIRFDIIAVHLRTEPEIVHFKDAFY